MSNADGNSKIKKKLKRCYYLNVLYLNANLKITLTN